MIREDQPVEPSRLTLFNRHDELDQLALWLESFASANELPAQAVFRLDLVLTEAITNLMDYAHGPGAEELIHLTGSVQGDHIDIELIDAGPAFDPTTYKPAALPKTLEEATPGGLGIHLIKQYTSHLEYRHENELNVLNLQLPIQYTPQRAHHQS